MRSPPALSPFQRPLDVETVPESGLETSIEATAEECAYVANAIDLPSVNALAARFQIERRPGGRRKLEGTVAARIAQICVVTLEPFDSDVVAPIEAMFAPATKSDRQSSSPKGSRRRPHLREAREAPPAARAAEGEEDDPPDLIIDGRIDLGAVAVEFLTLALEFYPRKPGAHFSDVVTGESAPAPSAFAALERLKDRS